MQITPKLGSLFHAKTHTLAQFFNPVPQCVALLDENCVVWTGGRRRLDGFVIMNEDPPFAIDQARNVFLVELCNPPLGSSHHLRPLLAQIPILYAPVRH
jgi:hypothetical protein